MNIRHIVKIQILIVLCLAVSIQMASAAGIKERMKARVPVIAELKAKGIVGENNRGYLAFVGSARASEDVIAAENKDRKAIYSHFAKKEKTTLDVVEKVQAERKAQKTKPGQYYQSPDGSWVKK